MYKWFVRLHTVEDRLVATGYLNVPEQDANHLPTCVEEWDRFFEYDYIRKDGQAVYKEIMDLPENEIYKLHLVCSLSEAPK